MGSQFLIDVAKLFVLLLGLALDLLNRAPTNADIAVSSFDLFAKFLPALFQVFFNRVQPGDNTIEHIFVTLGNLVLKLLESFP